MKDIINKACFTVKKKSPEILLVSGIAGVITSTVLACKATTKLNDILVDAKDELEDIRSKMPIEKMTPEEERELNKQVTIQYVKTGVDILKIYYPAILIGGLSIASLIASNNIQKQRNVALAAAYSTIDKSFKEYRNRVAKKFGEEVEKEIRYNLTNEKIDIFETDEEGKEKKKKQSVPVFEDGYQPSEYAKFFDEGCAGWEKDPEYNLMFLKAQQQYANDLLKAKGFLYLNDVYKMLGIPETKAGQIVGWKYDLDNPTGDNYVDFGIYNQAWMSNRDFVNGYERVILLDFNVDGNIWETM